MANVLTAVTPKLLAQGLMALRQNAVTAQLVNRRYEPLAGERGSTIDVPIPSAIAVQQVSPAATPPSTADFQPTSVPVALTSWWEAPFYMTDQDMLTAMEGTIPMQASEAIKSLANKIDATILATYTKFYGFHGNENAGAFLTPFTNSSGVATDAGDATKIRKILNTQLAPLDDRHVIMDPDGEAAALNIRAFQDTSWSGDPRAILEGQLNRRVGFNWWMDQNIPRHTSGTAAAATVTTIDANVVGDKTVTMKVSTGTATLVIGDIVSFANHTQTYVVTAAATLDTTGVAVSIEPGLVVAVDGSGTPVTTDVKPSHTVNLAIHRDAIAFATRPLAMHGPALGVISQSAVDPISGLTLRLEITHEHKRTRFSYDALWGVDVVRRELGARLAGV